MPAPDATKPQRRLLAQINVGRTLAPLDSEQLADFTNNLNRINELAERSPGFVWRMRDEDPSSSLGGATGARLADDPRFDDPPYIVNMSVWESVNALDSFVWRTVHARFYERKHGWFEPLPAPTFAMWRISPEERPSLTEGMAKLDQLGAEGPSAEVFGWEVMTKRPPLCAAE